jgi:hypothetical protein
MKSLEGGLNPDHLSSERHLYGGAFELDFISLHFRRKIRHADTGSHIELPTMPRHVTTDPTRLPSPSGPAPMHTGIVRGVADVIHVKNREGFAVHLFNNAVARRNIECAGLPVMALIAYSVLLFSVMLSQTGS